MMEAMRILKTVFPRPSRTILIGLWSGEEQGLNGSGSFAADHPEIAAGLQYAFNQDNGTGRVVNMNPGGLTGAGAVLKSYLTQIPGEITRHIAFTEPGSPAGGGSDNASFACHGAPAFGLGALSWDYSLTTWHTNRDTYDKIVVDDLKNNATLVAMLAYLASEDPETTERTRRVMPVSARTGEQARWPECRAPITRWEDYTR